MRLMRSLSLSRSSGSPSPNTVQRRKKKEDKGGAEEEEKGHKRNKSTGKDRDGSASRKASKEKERSSKRKGSKEKDRDSDKRQEAEASADPLASSLQNAAPDSGSEDSLDSAIASTIIVNSLDELPEDSQALLDRFHLNREVLEHNLDVVVHVLSFVQKRSLATTQFIEWRRQCKRDQVAIPPLNPPMPPLQELLSENNAKKIYKFIQKEGKGGFGSVYFAKHKRTGDLVAIKKVELKNAKAEEACRREIFFLKSCKHFNIVDYHDSFRVDNEIWIVMEYLEGYDVNRACEMFEFEEEHIAFIAQEALKGLEHLHARNMVHRDLKGANIMITCFGEVFLIDFGLMVDLAVTRTTHRCGTRDWMAPEMIRRDPQTPAVDIWSLAMCLTQMANGHAPSDAGGHQLKHMFRVARAGYGPSLGLDQPSKWSAPFIDFLSRALEFDPSARASASELLEHPWIRDNVTPDSAKSIASVVSYCEVSSTSGMNDMGF